MTKTIQISPVFAKGLALALTVVIFSADYCTPARINLSIFYACVLVILALSRSTRWLWIGTLATIGLAFLDLASGNGPGDGATGLDVTNRCITAFMLIVTAAFAQFSIALADKLVTQNHLLAEMSERTEAGKALQESERKYRELVEHANSIIVRWTRDGRITFINEFGLKFFDFTAEQLIGQHVMGTIVPEFESTSRDLRPLMEQILKDPKSFEKNTNENMRRGGERVWIAWTNKTVLDEQGQIKEVLSIGLDITERRQAEAQIAEQAAFLDMARDAIIVRAMDGHILFWSRGAETLFGWKREEVLGRNLRDIFATDPNPPYEEINELVLAKGEWAGEIRVVTRNRREVVADSRLTLIRDAAGNPKSILGITTDVTEKKIIEAQFLRAQRMESIGTLAGGIAHDLNNILTPILMSIDSLKTKTFDAQAIKMLESIGVSAKRGADIVRQLLTFARGIQGERVEIKPAHLLHDLELIIKDIFPKDIRLELSIPEETWKIMGDPTQMHQVLLNLCLNSRDAMPEGGDLCLGVENCALGERDAASFQAKPGPYVRFSVIDRGTGMPQEIIDKIFEPFFTTKDINKGTGLGLSTVSAIVKSHGGVIHVHSELGTGSIFHIYLPAMEAPSDKRTGPLAAIDLPRGKGETILLVDDEAPILAVTGQILESFGYHVLCASDGAEALAVYAKHQQQIALVLTDMRMPLMDGAAMIRAMIPLNPSIKIIAASGLDLNDPMAKLSGTGVKYFLAKPYTPEPLLKILRAALDA